MYKEIIKFIVIAIGLSTYMFSAGKQIQLNNGMWQAVGFQGVYQLTHSASTWDTYITNVLSDRADDIITYVAGDIESSDHYYVDIYNNRSTIPIPNTAPFYATVGIFAIKGEQSRHKSNYLILDGSELNSIHIKIQGVKEKSYNIPMYRMYVEGKDGMPTFRLDYQGDYEGILFRVKFGAEKDSYYSYFNSSKTYSHPADLYTESQTSIVNSSPIVNVVDFNISDNNLTLLEENRFRVLNSDGTIGGDGVSSFNAGLEDNILFYHHREGKWDIFNSLNVNLGSNDFETLTPGNGYWVQANSKRAHSDGNKTKIGILTRDSSDLLNTDYYDSLQVGWNMVSFPDTYLRYAATGMFISLDDIKDNSVNISFGRYSRHIPSDSNHTRDMNLTLGSAYISTTTDAVQTINTFITLRKLLYGEPIQIRAFPAMPSDGNGSQGVVIIGNSKFETNSSIATTLSGEPLIKTSGGFYSSVYGEYLLGLDINDLSGSHINASVDFFIPSYGDRQFNAVGASTSNVNEKSGSPKWSLVKKLDEALSKASIPIGKTKQATTTKMYLADFNFESNATKRDYSDTESYKSLLVTAGARFFVRDETYTKVFRVEDNGSFLILGNNDIEITSGNGAYASGLGVIDSINEYNTTTNIIATDLGSNYMAITSPSKRNLDLLEDNIKTLFIDIPLHDVNIPTDGARFTRGAITKVYTFLNLLTPRININTDHYTGSKFFLPDTNISSMAGFTSSNATSYGEGTYIGVFPSSTIDLRENSVWAIDFPSDGIIEKLASYGKEMTTIMTMNTSPDNNIYWSFIDLTKSPDTWYTQHGKDTQDIFHLFNQKAYWVQVRDKTFIPDTLKKVASYVYQQRVVSHFDNTLIGGIGKTTNHIDHTLNITLNKAFIDPIQNPYYDVVAIISGEEYRLKYNGTGFQIRLNSSTIRLDEKNATAPADAIILKVYDGLGNNLIETPLNHTFEIDYFKPSAPSVEWDGHGELVSNVSKNSAIEYYSQYISDIEAHRVNYKLSNKTLSLNKDLGWSDSRGSRDGVLKKLRIVIKTDGINNQYFYSDSVGLLYAPLKYGHALSVSAEPRAPKTSLTPYSFIQKQILTPVDNHGNYPNFDGVNGVNNGVQITLLKEAVDLKRSIQMVYYPDIEEVGVKEGDKRLTAFGGNYTMYLKISTKNNTNTKPIAKITYIKSYAGKIFYISYGNFLYQGVFQGSTEHNSDAASYNLHSGTLGLSFDIAGTQGHKVGFSSRNIVPSQPIVIPGVITQTTTTNITPLP